MSMRERVRALTVELASVSEDTFRTSANTVRYLIEKSTIRPSKPAEAEEFYQEMLGAEDARVTLTEREVDALVDVLNRNLEVSPPRAALAASCLAPSQRLYALPPLARAMHRWAEVDGWTARQLIVAIEDIVLAAIAPGTSLAVDEEGFLNEACRALSFAEAQAKDDVSMARSAAHGARKAIVSHTHRPC